jgi:hypothetical protein
MLWFSKLGRFFLPRPIDALVSRRLPEGLDNATLIAVDLTDPARCADVFGHMPEVTHVIYAALYEKPGLVQGWFEQDQMQTNLAMLDNVMTPLEPVAKELQHVSLLQGTKAYGVHIAPFPVPARERWPRHPHDRSLRGSCACWREFRGHNTNFS